MLEFETKHGRQRQIEWTTKPLGVSFDRAMPMKVTEVHEEALHLNIRIGDTLTRYGLDGALVVHCPSLRQAEGPGEWKRCLPGVED